MSRFSRIRWSIQEAPFATQFATIVAKPRGGQRADAMATPLRRKIAKADPNLPLYFIGTPKAQIDGFVAQNRIIATMFSIFGLVAIVLASVGMYGVMSFSVNQRRQEFACGWPLARTPAGSQDGPDAGVIQLAVGLLIGWSRADPGDGRRRGNSERPVWRHRTRSTDVQRRRYPGHGRLDHRDDRPGATGHARRPDDRSAR